MPWRLAANAPPVVRCVSTGKRAPCPLRPLEPAACASLQQSEASWRNAPDPLVVPSPGRVALDTLQGRETIMDENDKGVSRRRALTILGLGGAVVATVALPSKWTRPLVESIVVPAHAQASGGGGNGGSSTTYSDLDDDHLARSRGATRRPRLSAVCLDPVQACNRSRFRGALPRSPCRPAPGEVRSMDFRDGRPSWTKTTRASADAVH